MAVLTRELYKLIEGKLHNRFRMREAVERWHAELDDVYPEDAALSPPVTTEGSGGLADTTAQSAIRRVQPPREIREAERWLKVIGIVKGRYEGTPKGMLLDAYYDGTPRTKGRVQRVSNVLYVDRATVYNWRDEIVNFTALVSATENIIKKV